jgi:IclR family pca regulon transcriptional regulator
MGKLLLAYLPEPDQRELLATMRLTKRGPNTITAKRALRDELQRIASDGFAVDDQELARDLYAVAAPVRDATREVVAAMSLSADSSTISLGELVDAFIPHLLSSADQVSARLGYRRDGGRG